MPYNQPFLSAPGEMSALIRAHDWASTPLGPPNAWPQTLKSMTRIALTTRHPMFIFWGAEHICLYNDAYRASLGPEKHPAILGRRGRDAWPEIWEIIGPQIELVMRGEGATWHENQLVPIIRHGELQEVYWTYSYGPIDDPTAPSGVGGVLVVCTETTEQVLAEQRRQAEIERLRSLFAQAPGFMCVLRGPDHIFELANAAYRTLAGDRAMIGKCVRDALPEVADQGYIALLDQVYASGVAFEGREQSIRLQRSPGEPPEERFLDFVYQPIADANGAVTGVFVEGVDVTERVLSRKALEANEARLSAALAIAQLGAFEWDRRTGDVILDARGREMFGFGPDEPIRENDIVARIDPADIERILEEVAASRDGNSRLETGYRIVRPDDTQRSIVSISDVTADAAGRVVRMVGVFADVTERTRLEEERRTILDALAHDLKTPLTTLKTHAQLLNRMIARGRMPDAETLSERVALFVDLADRMADLVGDLGAHARLAMGQPVDLEREPTDLVGIVAEAIDEIRQAGVPHSIRFEHEAEELVGSWDPQLLRRLVGNLLGNAVKYSPGGDEIAVRVGTVDGDAELIVRDTGIGIPADDLPRIFTLRQRGGNVAGIAGSGIGLAGVKRIVDQHRGTISVESVEGAGATFTVRLPIAA
ncbi:MAG: PAS domain-containing protein [Thermomicrobiales bacterium]|nr:PAS domain-containing protein [Thermomicrobiales bacterium]